MFHWSFIGDTSKYSKLPEFPKHWLCTHPHLHMVWTSVILLVQNLKVVSPRGHETAEKRREGGKGELKWKKERAVDTLREL